MMKRLLILGIVAFSVPARAEEPAGKAVLLQHKCQSCHSVTSAGILPARGEDSAEGPDLSNVGAAHSADWLNKYLLKQESKDGKKHKRRFPGTEQELNVLVKWLASLKSKTSP